MPRKKNLNDGKRRDDKGRVLRTGEGQRKDGTYEYRFTDINGKRSSIYDHDLTHLRKKEEKVTGMRLDIIPNNTEKRVALTEKQQKRLG